MKAGDKIRVAYYYLGGMTHNEDYVIEEHMFCLGFFRSEDAKKANHFTPLCELYERGPESEDGYIPNYGEYYTNPVQSWMDLPS